MKVVKNGVVKMDWDADGFVETKKLGFIAAVHTYGDVAIAFADGVAYTHVFEDGTYPNLPDLVATIKRAVKEKDSDYPTYYDDYAEICNGVEFMEGTMETLGILSEDVKADILARLEDLAPYWEEVEVPMA